MRSPETVSFQKKSYVKKIVCVIGPRTLNNFKAKICCKKALQCFSTHVNRYLNLAFQNERIGTLRTASCTQQRSVNSRTDNSDSPPNSDKFSGHEYILLTPMLKCTDNLILQIHSDSLLNLSIFHRCTQQTPYVKYTCQDKISISF